MPRLSDQAIEQIKAVPLVEVLTREGLALKAKGKDVVACCVFHADKTASLTISPDKNLYHCFGCGAAGTVVDWVMKRRGLSFRAACDALQVEYGLSAPLSQKGGGGDSNGTGGLLSLDANSPQAALNAVIDYYHHTLKNNREALAYLAKRGLLAGVRGGQVIDTFKLGYANRTLTYRLPDKTRIAGAAVRKMLQDVGILRASGHEHLNGSFVIPIIDIDGNVLDVYGRKIRDDLREGTAYHLYLKGEHKGVWNADALYGHKEVIVCEALIDALSYWVHGFDNVTATYGVRGFTPAHDALFRQLKTQGLARVLIGFDADSAGDTAAREFATRLQALGLSSSRIEYPRGMDANQIAQQPDAAEQIKALVLKAVSMVEVVAHDEHVAAVYSSATKALADTSTVIPPLVKGGEGDLPTSQQDKKTDQNTELQGLQGNASEYFLHLEGRTYRIRGLDNNKHSDDVLKVQLAVYVDDLLHLDKLDLSEDQRGTASPERKTTQCVAQGVGLMHLDKLDLYSYKQRQAFIHQAVAEVGLPLEVLKKDVGQLLRLLEQARHELSLQANDGKAHTPMTVEQTTAALELLTRPNLAERILNDFNAAGVVGEDANKLVGYLACVSRKLDRPLAVLIQSSSAAGKSSLMDAILQLMPEDERVQYSAMTGQSLYYMGENDLKHKILAISEEEGAHQASYALKLLQSEGKVKIASAGKDEATGKLTTQEYEVEGPVMLMMTTTAIDIDEELLNRCLVLSVNEGRAQTEAIHAIQRQKRTLTGLHAKLHSQHIKQTHQHAQSLLERLAVINPFADQLTFSSHKTRTRRDHEKYLTLIDAIALLHQKQRPIHSLDVAGQAVRYVEVQWSDIELANTLAIEVLGRTLDELPPQTRKLLNIMYAKVCEHLQVEKIKQSHFHFSRRDVRGWCGWSDKQVRVHLERLVEMEYLLVHRGAKGKSYVYELLYQGEGLDDGAFVMGLLTTEVLKTSGMTTTSWGERAEVVGSKWVQSGGVVGEQNQTHVNNSNALAANFAP